MKGAVNVKICGITNTIDLEAAILMGANTVGFITGVKSSPRNIPENKVKQLVHNTKSADSVIVMAPCDTEQIENMYNYAEPDYIQVHGDTIIEELLESPTDLPLIIGVNPDYDMDSMLKLSRKHSILVDSKVSGVYGGTGVIHDWGLSRRIRDHIYPERLILAGGLTPENVSKAIRIVNPYGVDVSSGVESHPGVKDHEKMRTFIKAVREVMEER